MFLENENTRILYEEASILIASKMVIDQAIPLDLLCSISNEYKSSTNPKYHLFNQQELKEHIERVKFAEQQLLINLSFDVDYDLPHRNIMTIIENTLSKKITEKETINQLYKSSIKFLHDWYYKHIIIIIIVVSVVHVSVLEIQLFKFVL